MQAATPLILSSGWTVVDAVHLFYTRFMTSTLLRALDRGVLVLDGAMGSALQSMPLDIEKDYLGHENCVDLLVRSRPEG